MVEKLLPITIAAVCVLLMIRLLIGPRRRYRLDAFARRVAAAMRRRTLWAWRWRASRKQAARAAEEAIRRAREGGSWEGNVYKPKSFKRPRKPH